MSTMWGLMIEVVDLNCAVEVEVDGDIVLAKKEVILRVCDPTLDCRILVKSIPAGIKEIKVTLFVGEEKTVQVGGLVEAGEAMDEVCAFEVVSEIQATAFDEVAAALSKRDFDRASDANYKGVTAVEMMFNFDKTPEAVKTFIVTTLKEMEEQAQDIINSKDNYFTARETELYALSRSSTTRNSGTSIDPSGNALSDLQSQLIDL